MLSNPSYGAAVQRPADLIEPLRSFCASGDHVFWSRVGRTRRRVTWWKRLDAYLSSCDSLKYSSAGYAQVAAMYRTDDGPGEQ